MFMAKNKNNTFEALQKINRKSMNSVLSELRSSYFFIAWKARMEEAQTRQTSCKEKDASACEDTTSFKPYYINKEIASAI